ncbi:hypothetical protein H2203_008232 [Taxawa tesnikishii (nom. ined.)]|nr:hypothetical protein H2203_008232 [Dothideales sp. JES 119]
MVKLNLPSAERAAALVSSTRSLIPLPPPRTAPSSQLRESLSASHNAEGRQSNSNDEGNDSEDDPNWWMADYGTAADLKEHAVPNPRPAQEEEHDMKEPSKKQTDRRPLMLKLKLHQKPQGAGRSANNTNIEQSTKTSTYSTANAKTSWIAVNVPTNNAVDEEPDSDDEPLINKRSRGIKTRSPEDDGDESDDDIPFHLEVENRRRASGDRYAENATYQQQLRDEAKAAGQAMHFICECNLTTGANACENDQQYGPSRAYARYLISNQFGGTKGTWDMVPKNVRITWARSCYQRKDYVVKGGHLDRVKFKINMIRRQLQKLLAWRPKAKYTIQLAGGLMQRVVNCFLLADELGIDLEAAAEIVDEEDGTKSGQVEEEEVGFHNETLADIETEGGVKPTMKSKFRTRGQKPEKSDEKEGTGYGNPSVYQTPVLFANRVRKEWCSPRNTKYDKTVDDISGFLDFVESELRDGTITVFPAVEFLMETSPEDVARNKVRKDVRDAKLAEASKLNNNRLPTGLLTGAKKKAAEAQLVREIIEAAGEVADTETTTPAGKGKGKGSGRKNRSARAAKKAPAPKKTSARKTATAPKATTAPRKAAAAPKVEPATSTTHTTMTDHNVVTADADSESSPPIVDRAATSAPETQTPASQTSATADHTGEDDSGEYEKLLQSTIAGIKAKKHKRARDEGDDAQPGPSNGVKRGRSAA